MTFEPPPKTPFLEINDADRWFKIETPNGIDTCFCATPHSTRLDAIRYMLQFTGWRIHGVDSSFARKKLLLTDDRMMWPLDTAHMSERAEGFRAARDDAQICVEASSGLPLAFSQERGDCHEVHNLVKLILLDRVNELAVPW